MRMKNKKTKQKVQPKSEVRVSFLLPAFSTRETPTKVKRKLMKATSADNQAAAEMEETPDNLITEAASWGGRNRGSTFDSVQISDAFPRWW